MPFLRPFVRADIRGATATLRQDLIYDGRDDTFTVPTGFVTDFASVPRFMTWLVPTMGAYTEAAVLHDWLCTQLEQQHEARVRLLVAERHRSAMRQVVPALAPANARDTDGIFRRVCREGGTPLVRRWLLWTGVRWGALANPARRPGWWRDAPTVLGISLLTLPLLLLPAAAVGLTLLVDTLVEATTGPRVAA